MKEVYFSAPRRLHINHTFKQSYLGQLTGRSNWTYVQLFVLNSEIIAYNWKQISRSGSRSRCPPNSNRLFRRLTHFKRCMKVNWALLKNPRYFLGGAINSQQPTICVKSSLVSCQIYKQMPKLMATSRARSLAVTKTLRAFFVTFAAISARMPTAHVV